jgi:hypothetical protein
MEVKVTASHSFFHLVSRLNQPAPIFGRSLFHVSVTLDSRPNPPGLNFWTSSLFVLFLLEISSGVLLCVVGLGYGSTVYLKSLIQGG